MQHSQWEAGSKSTSEDIWLSSHYTQLYADKMCCHLISHKHTVTSHTTYSELPPHETVLKIWKLSLHWEQKQASLKFRYLSAKLQCPTFHKILILIWISTTNFYSSLSLETYNLQMEEWGPWTEVAQHRGEYVRGGAHQGVVVSPQLQAGSL